MENSFSLGRYDLHVGRTAQAQQSCLRITIFTIRYPLYTIPNIYKAHCIFNCILNYILTHILNCIFYISRSIERTCKITEIGSLNTKGPNNYIPHAQGIKNSLHKASALLFHSLISRNNFHYTLYVIPKLQGT